ncbi:MAG: carbohydrate kinase [Clostridia bacterium]|nr:carbohydrate kinase [Clostridia bacterium]
MADFYALGEMLIDFTPAGKTPAGIPIFEQNPGGAPANVAVQAARLGVNAGFIGKVGEDMFGTFLKQTLLDHGVDAKNMLLSEDTATSLAFVQLSETGDRDFSFYRNPGADTQITFEEVSKEDLENAKVLCFGSLLLTAEPARTAVPQIVKYAREHGVITAYDPNWRQPLWPDDETGIAAMKSLLPFADVIKASDEELTMLTGCAEIEEGAKVLFDLGIQAVVITRGAKGCAVCTKTETLYLSTYDTKVVDTTGSGDSFFGAFLTKLMETDKPVSEITVDELREAADFGNAAGAVCATKKGAIPALPDREAIAACRAEVPLLKL